MPPVGSLAFELLAATLAPPRCAACDARVPLLTAFCPVCAASAQRAAPDDAPSTAAFVYGGAIARAVTRLKYERRPDLARPLGDLLWREVERRTGASRRGPRGTLVVPVPLHPARLAARGYNQAALLAARIAPRMGVPMRPLALARTRDTAHQAALDRDARIANVAGAFVAREPLRVRGRDVLLVDDVRTTGATLDACAHALRDAGAARVAWAVVACVDSR